MEKKKKTNFKRERERERERELKKFHGEDKQSPYALEPKEKEENQYTRKKSFSTSSSKTLIDLDD